MALPEIIKDIDARVIRPTSTDNSIVRFNGATGQVQNTANTIDDNNNTVINGSLRLQGSSNPWLKLDDGSSNTWYVQSVQSGNSMGFGNGWDKSLKIDNNGNVIFPGLVGIGTTSPSYKLHVIGDIYANGGWLRTSGNAGWYSESYGGGWYMTDSTYIRNFNSKTVRLDNLCLGIDNNDYKLYVNGISRFNNTLYFFNSIGDTALSIESRRSKNSSNTDIEINTGLVTKNKSFIEIRGFAPPTMIRTTGDRSAPYGLGFGNGNESAGIMPIGEGDRLQELMFYGANSGPTLFTWKYQTWEATNYDADTSNGYSAAMMSLNSQTGDLYIKNTVGINGQNTGYRLYVNGSSNITGNLKLDGSITNLAINGGIYWNPYVESASDPTDAASITVIKSGVAGGTELRISQANDANDIVNISVPTNDAARVNNNIILHTGNIQSLLSFPKIAIGSYVGTGTSDAWGGTQQNSLTFDFEPKMLAVVADGSNIFFAGFLIVRGQTYSDGIGGMANTSVSSQLHITWSGNTVSWWSSNRIDIGTKYPQMNVENKTYRYIALG